MGPRTSLRAILVSIAATLAPFAVGIAPEAADKAAPDTMRVVTPDQSDLKWTSCGDPWPRGCEFVMLWGDPAGGGAYTALVRAPAGYLFPRHAHSSPERIVLLGGRVAGASDGTVEVTVAPGSFWNLPEKVVHWARCDEACVLYVTYEKPYDVTFAK